MSSMTIGGATVAIVEHKRNAMHCEAFPSKLAAVLCMIDFGDLGGGLAYGGDEHKAALVEVEKQIAKTRACIAEMEGEDAAAAGVEGPSTDQMLGDLLARIHRDGGHYVMEHGWQKAAEDAEAKVLAERRALALACFEDEAKVAFYLSEAEQEANAGVLVDRHETECHQSPMDSGKAGK